MAIALIKELAQKQKVTLTPQLKKSIDLLQLSRYEIIQKINEEIEINPFLEKNEPEVNDYEGNDELGIEVCRNFKNLKQDLENEGVEF